MGRARRDRLSVDPRARAPADACLWSHGFARWPGGPVDRWRNSAPGSADCGGDVRESAISRDRMPSPDHRRLYWFLPGRSVRLVLVLLCPSLHGSAILPAGRHDLGAHPATRNSPAAKILKPPAARARRARVFTDIRRWSIMPKGRTLRLAGTAGSWLAGEVCAFFRELR